MDPELIALANVYLRHHASHLEEDFWAWQEVERRVRADLSQGWAVTRLLVEKADSDATLGYVAAGPLEDLVDETGMPRSMSSRPRAKPIRRCNSR